MVLVCATFPLIWVGGLVTTYDAGMAVPDWPNTYGYNLFLYPWTTWISGPWDLFIEHGHRLLGACVGLLVILLLIVVWRQESRRWVRWLAVGCLALVILQGVLGGGRVLMDDLLLARIHGCTGPLFFLSCVALAAVTSPWWRSKGSAANHAAARLQRPAWVALGFALVQLVLGAHLRHLPADWSPSTFRGLAVVHLLLAIVLLAQVIWLTARCWGDANTRRRPLLWRPATAIALLVATQICLGIATWMVKYSWPTWLPRPATFRTFTVQAESMTQAVTVTAHVAVGSLILATALLLALRATRLAAQRVSDSEVLSGASRTLEALA
jgi:cytochrome c oxidase assembly protein subunit 15